MGQGLIFCRCPLGTALSQLNISTAATRCILSPSHRSLWYPGHSLAPPSPGGRWRMRKREGAQPPSSLVLDIPTEILGTGTGHSCSHGAFGTNPTKSYSKWAKPSALTPDCFFFLVDPPQEAFYSPSQHFQSSLWAGQGLCLLSAVLMHEEIFRKAGDTFPLHKPTKCHLLRK